MVAMTPSTTRNSLLAEVLEAHGGLERWRAFDGMSSTIVTGGQLWPLKGASITATPRLATTEFRRQRTSVTPFGKRDWTMRWRPERVVVKTGAGKVIAERDHPRAAFTGHEYQTPWDALHLAYFNGYAMWTYHALPFVLAEPGYEVAEIASLVHEGQHLRGLRVRFPIEVHTHTREQRLYFDGDGLLRRHDYEVDVWAGTPAAHMLSDYITVAGLHLPTRRIVHPRKPDLSFDDAVTVVTIGMSDYVLHRTLPDSDAHGGLLAGFVGKGVA